MTERLILTHDIFKLASISLPDSVESKQVSHTDCERQSQDNGVLEVIETDNHAPHTPFNLIVARLY